MRRLHVLVVAAPLLASACADCPPPQPPAPPAPPPVAVAPPPPATPAPTTVRRTLVSLTRPSGEDVTTTSADGRTVTVAFEMRWNGRGPKADATFRLGADGTIASFEAHGHHMKQAPVDETFAMEGGHARWKSREESGEADLRSPAFFVPIADVPDALGLLAQALLKAGGTMPLLPAGEARLEKVGEATVSAAGRTKHLTRYDVTGLDLTPDPVWMEDDGSWFGVVAPWFSLVPEGWESAIEPLIAEQERATREHDRATAARLAHRPPAAGLALAHARVLDVERGRWIPDQTVVVVGGAIAAVGPSRTTRVPAGAEVVDLAGKALLPGLWDMHSHLGDPDGALDIASGVTTARDVGNDPDKVDDFKKRYDEGAAIGPHVLRAGFIEGRGEKASSSKITAETPEEARAGVEFYAKRGYEMIKVYNSVKPELVPLITKEAHARGMTVTGHVPVHMLAHEVVRDGYDGIEHANMLFLNFFADHDTDTRTPLRFTVVGDKAADFDLASKPVKDFFAYLHAHGTVIDPTLVVHEGTFTARQGEVPPGKAWIVKRLPVQAQRSFLTGGLPLDGKEDLYRRSFAKMVSIVKALHDAKVTVVAGTDSLAGLSLDRELELFVEGGLTPAEALRDATIVPARVMKLDKKTGSVAVGKAADLVVVDGDPLARIADVRRTVTTVRGGVVFPAKETFATVGVRPWE